MIAHPAYTRFILYKWESIENGVQITPKIRNMDKLQVGKLEMMMEDDDSMNLKTPLPRPKSQAIEKKKKLFVGWVVKEFAFQPVISYYDVIHSLFIIVGVSPIAWQILLQHVKQGQLEVTTSNTV